MELFEEQSKELKANYLLYRAKRTELFFDLLGCALGRKYSNSILLVIIVDEIQCIINFRRIYVLSIGVLIEMLLESEIEFFILINQYSNIDLIKQMDHFVDRS